MSEPRRIRIGAVPYLNTRPLVEGMERGLGAERIDLSYAVPSALANRMADGRLDVALLPVVALADLAEVEIVPGLGIVTRGASRSVLLVSRVPVERVESVALDPDSRTSNALVQVLFAEVWQRRPTFQPGDADLDRALETCDAVVRIGDKALFEPPRPGTHVQDLGAVWTEATGLPFVFAVWAARPGAVDREIYRILHASRRQGSKAISRISEEYAWRGVRDPALSLAYLTEHIHFRLGSAEIEAMNRFLGAAERLGLISRAPEIRMALERRTRCDDVAETRRLTTPSSG